MLLDLSQIKKCNTCQVVKTWGEFHIRNEKPRSDCKNCRCAKEVLSNKKSLNGATRRLKPIRICPIVKLVKKRQQSKKWKIANKDHITAYKKDYKEKNKEANAAYVRNRRKNDLSFAIAQRIRERLTHALTSKSWKKTTHFSEYIGCTREELYTHIESQFSEGMSWENRSEWHIDHIMPISTAKTTEELYELNHYLNLRPLWKRDNIKKSNRITEAGHQALANVKKAKGQI